MGCVSISLHAFQFLSSVFFKRSFTPLIKVIPGVSFLFVCFVVAIGNKIAFLMFFCEFTIITMLLIFVCRLCIVQLS